jgi:DNA-binding FadR family transcriptional regulator
MGEHARPPRPAEQGRAGQQLRRIGRAPSSSRADQAAAEIARAIAGAEPGARLGTKDALRAQVGVSEGTFNETLRILQARGLVEVKRGPGGGLFAAEQSAMAQLGHAVLSLDTDSSSIAEAVRMRDALDPLLIDDAVQYSSAHDVGRMRDQLDRMKAAVDEDSGIDFLHANWQLHACIVATSPHPILRAVYTSLLNLVEEHTIAVASSSRQPSLREFHVDRHAVHVALVDAIADRDRERALALIAEHNQGIALPG